MKHSSKTPPEDVTSSGSLLLPPGFWMPFSPADLYLLIFLLFQAYCIQDPANLSVGMARFGFGSEAIPHAVGDATVQRTAQ